MAQGIYTPDPDAKALSSTRAGTFDKRPCANTTAFCVDRSGRTVDVRTVDRCYDAKVDEICRNAVKRWRFRPFIVAGAPTTICTTVLFQVNFGALP